MGITDKIGKYLQKFKVSITPVETYRGFGHGTSEMEEIWEAVIKRGNVIIAKSEFQSEADAKKWSNDYIKKYGEMGRLKEEIDINRMDDYYEMLKKKQYGSDKCPKCGKKFAITSKSNNGMYSRTGTCYDCGKFGVKFGEKRMKPITTTALIDKPKHNW